MQHKLYAITHRHSINSKYALLEIILWILQAIPCDINFTLLFIARLCFLHPFLRDPHLSFSPVYLNLAHERLKSVH